MRPTGLLDGLEKLALPGRGGVGRVRPSNLELDVWIVHDLLEIRDKRTLVRVWQQATIEAHLSLLGNDVDLVAAAHHRQADAVVEQRPTRALGDDLALRLFAAQAADHLCNRWTETVLRLLAQDRVGRSHQP